MGTSDRPRRTGGGLGIIAGRGDLPCRLIAACRAQGRDVFVLALKGQTPSETVRDVPHAWVRLGAAAGEGIRRLRDAGVVELVMAGALTRPSLAGLFPDWPSARFLAKTGAMALGDDGLLGSIAKLLEREGFRVVGAETVLPDMIAREGVYGAHAPGDLSRADIATGVAAAKDLGAHDVGQGVVVRDGAVIAREGADGTDAMLARVARLGGKGGVLVKTVKPGQDTRIDRPAIGAGTVAAAAAAGLDGIAVEADGALVIDEGDVVRDADALGVFVVGVPRTDEGPLIFLIAGEPSGDVLGARLMEALKAQTAGHIRFAGVGGPQMAAEGLNSLFPMAELSIMGVFEVLPRLPGLIRRIRQTVRAAKAARPDAVVTIDSPGFTFRVAQKLKGAGFPLIHYVAPTVWAWKPKRAAKIAKFLDHLMVLLPFEPPYFEREGLPTTFVGHPVIERGADKGDGAAFRARHAIPTEAPLLCVLPGSRHSETARLLPVFEETFRLLRAARPGLRAIIPTVATVEGAVRDAVAGWDGPVTVVTGEAEKFDAFAASDAALAASGTVALELAAAGTPTVVAYRVNPLTAWLVRRLVRVRFVNLVNIILDRDVVPERLQDDCRADVLAGDLGTLLDNEAAARAQIEQADAALEQLGRGGVSPGERAALCVLDVIAGKETK